jgi:hypothetical protein
MITNTGQIKAILLENKLAEKHLERKLIRTTEMLIKSDVHTGRFMDVKMDGTPFKGIRREKAMDVINKLKDR